MIMLTVFLNAAPSIDYFLLVNGGIGFRPTIATLNRANRSLVS